MEVYYRKAENLEEDLRELLRLLRWEEIVKKHDRVLIKPNFCTHELGDGVTTSTELLNTLARIVKERSENVFVGETHSGGKDFEKLRNNLALNCEFVNLSETETYEFAGKHGVYKLPKLVKECRIINVPILKTHILTGITLGIKNLFGLIQRKDKAKYHFRINRVLSDIAAIQPQINILDATYSMDGNGPRGGKIRETGFLLASRSVIALDAAACELVGIEPSSIEHIRQASQYYGARYKLVGDGFERLHFQVPKPGKIIKFAALMQSNDITRKVIENPKLLPIARKVKRTLEKKLK